MVLLENKSSKYEICQIVMEQNKYEERGQMADNNQMIIATGWAGTFLDEFCTHKATYSFFQDIWGGFADECGVCTSSLV